MSIKYHLILILGLMLTFSLSGCLSNTKNTNSIGQKFVYIKSGSFMMGSSSGESCEKPPHRVNLTRGFYMQTTEVTQGQWYDVMGRKPWSGKRKMGDMLTINI